jgi:hypothetical protein
VNDNAKLMHRRRGNLHARAPLAIIEGKLEAIITKLPAFSWRKEEPPNKRIKNLKNLRDSIAHAKVVATEYITERKGDGTYFQFKHPWDSYLSVEAVKSARTDIKSFCQSLIIELRKESDHLHLNFDAFEGSLASGFGMSKVD